jgi:outer membrane immunogenic protein
MKRFVLASAVALAAVTTMTAANAADLGRRHAMPTKAPMYAAPYNWTGFYAGINGGGGWGTSTWSAATGSNSFDTSGGVVGGTLGYNWQMNQVVFGLEGDLDWSNIRGTTSAVPCTTSCETRNNWLGTVRGRVGYAFDRFLPYLTGGLAVGDIKADPAGFGGESETKAGWTLGGGLEVAIAGPWTAKIEYLYADLGKTTCPAGSCALSADVDFHTSLVRGGINYRF